MSANLLPENGEFQIESYDEMNSRYSGFGENLIQKLLSSEPTIEEQIEYYKRVDFQLEDSYAVITNLTASIAIQLDPLSEVIILWNNDIHIEKGQWTENLLAETIGLIKTILNKEY